MRKVLWGLFAIFLAIALPGCGRFSEQEAIFIGHNHSNDAVALIIDGQEKTQLAPNSTTNKEFIVLVPHPPGGGYGYGTAPSDRQVQVTVVFKNLRTGRLSRESHCNAGGKIKTLVVYEPQTGTDGYVYCSALY